uniref:Uncharacterized protein n=1 Tax=Aegilops tauschii TaxID=37682 RepID=M8CRT6_AEGTA
MRRQCQGLKSRARHDFSLQIRWQGVWDTLGLYGGWGPGLPDVFRCPRSRPARTAAPPLLLPLPRASTPATTRAQPRSLLRLAHPWPGSHGRGQGLLRLGLEDFGHVHGGQGILWKLQIQMAIVASRVHGLALQMDSANMPTGVDCVFGSRFVRFLQLDLDEFPLCISFSICQISAVGSGSRLHVGGWPVFYLWMVVHVTPVPKKYGTLCPCLSLMRSLPLMDCSCSSDKEPDSLLIDNVKQAVLHGLQDALGKSKNDPHIRIMIQEAVEEGLKAYGYQIPKKDSKSGESPSLMSGHAHSTGAEFSAHGAASWDPGFGLPGSSQPNDPSDEEFDPRLLALMRYVGHCVTKSVGIGFEDALKRKLQPDSGEPTLNPIFFTVYSLDFNSQQLHVDFWFVDFNSQLLHVLGFTVFSVDFSAQLLLSDEEADDEPDEDWTFSDARFARQNRRFRKSEEKKEQKRREQDAKYTKLMKEKAARAEEARKEDRLEFIKEGVLGLQKSLGKVELVNSQTLLLSLGVLEDMSKDLGYLMFKAAQETKRLESEKLWVYVGLEKLSQKLPFNLAVHVKSIVRNVNESKALYPIAGCAIVLSRAHFTPLEWVEIAKISNDDWVEKWTKKLQEVHERSKNKTG